MDDCLFCGIVDGNILSKKVYEDAFCYAFEDINPQAAVHILIIPKKHIASLQEAAATDQALLGGLLLRIGEIARSAGIAEDGYRVVTNVGAHGCQSVKHLHFHILGGEQLKGDMG